MNRILLFLILLIPIGVFSFNKKKWKHTATGIYYKIYSSDTTQLKPVYGDHIWMHLKKYGLNKKEMFNTRIFDINSGVEMDYKKPERKTDVTEIFSLMGKGDSAFVMIPSNLADSNGSTKKYYTFWLNLIDFKTKESYLSERKEHYKQQVILDSLSMADYIRNNNLQDCTPDEYGNWFIRKQPGTGKQVKENDSVTIHYVGKLLTGKQFDNSYDRKQSFTFVVGNRQVIDGLDNGIRNFFYGDKGILIIPSRLGYGDKEVGKIIANSVLIFELEILP